MLRAGEPTLSEGLDSTYVSSRVSVYKTCAMKSRLATFWLLMVAVAIW